MYFRFAGRLLGRALFDQQLIRGHLVQSLYKQLLGLPLTFEDLAAQDETYHHSLKELMTLADVSILCLDFTVTENIAGELKMIELVPDGANKDVTNDNVGEYLEALLRYRILERTKPQLTELLLGFLDVVPEPALAVFDSMELELLLCGLPIIDVDDWEANTRYSGSLKKAKKDHQLVKWFWEIVRHSFNHETRARLLQFVTGTSGVSSRGFASLQGVDGSVKTFAIYGIEDGPAVYPRAQ
jgi:E3 ubiquitin-protein ligase NEDD4